MDPFHAQINRINDAIEGCMENVITIKQSYKNKIPQYYLKIDTTDVEKVLNKLDVELCKLNQKVRVAGYLDKSRSFSLFDDDDSGDNSDECNRG